MAGPADAAVPSTPAAAAASAQTRVGTGLPPGRVAPAAPGRSGCTIGPGVTRGARVRPYERKVGDPLYRPLRVYALDPAASAAEGAVAMVNVPYEPLRPGPTGAVFRVDPVDAGSGEAWRAVNLDDPAVLITSGRAPSPADPRFHQQMVYAVASLTYAAFRTALGRQVGWGFTRGDDGEVVAEEGEAEEAGVEGGEATEDAGEDVAEPAPREGDRLVLRPHGGELRNAWYDRGRGEIRFGYYRAEQEVTGRNVPGGFVFTCLSHDIVVHEVTHALLDGLRAHFLVPTRPDVAGFHEGFADLVAIFQHFSYPELVRAAVRHSRGVLTQSQLIMGLARQFGHTTGSAHPLRTAIDVTPEGTLAPRRYRADAEEHEMGSVLVSAVFDAYLAVYRRKTERYVRLATGGTGVLPEGELPEELQSVLAEEASQLASQFLAACIRAIDYCPPVDIALGEFLRAVLTADYDLVPDDPWGYREAWIDAFGRHGIYPPGVRSLAEDELRWDPPEVDLPAVDMLSFKRLRFEGDPARPSGPRELRRQARELGAMVMGNLRQFGCAAPGDPALGGDEVDPPCVQSIRSARRVGPDGQVVFDLVAEVTQRRVVRAADGGGFVTYGGATALLGPRGEVRYVIAKHVASVRRLEDQKQFLAGPGAAFWGPGPDGMLHPRDDTFFRMHARRFADPG
ncbi:MAG TPA: hypothetical protein VLK84_26110 [Longimicrobium sp.]|nr:hypothetical protein [Longimicrobium sp.]